MGWSAQGLDPDTGTVAIMNGDLDTKTPNSSVASPRKRVNGEGMLAVQECVIWNTAALQESADISMQSFYGLLAAAGCMLQAEEVRNGTIRYVVRSACPSPRPVWSGKLCCGLLAISRLVAVIACQRSVLQVLQA